MRDTLLLVLACAGGAFLVSVACAAMWIAGNACVDWYDRMLTNREYAAKVDRVASTWQARLMPQSSDEIHPHKHTVVFYDSLDDFHRDVRIELELRAARRAGARGESDG